MGIYDREYIRVGPRSKSGLGSLRFISFNSWLIIVNVAVFILDILLASHAVPIVIDTEPANLNLRGKQITGPYLNALRQQIPAQVPILIRDRSGNVYQDPKGRTVPNPALRPGGVVFRQVADANGQAVGVAEIAFMPPLVAYGHFSTFYGFERFEMWRYITFQFLHGGVSHIFFNMFGLWIFGGMVEQYLGFKRYAAFYLTCGIFGAIAYLVLNLLGAQLGLSLPGLLIDSIHTPLIGASAGVFGVILACAYIAPDAIVQLLIPPIPIKLKWFAYGYVAVAAWNLFRGGHNAGGDAAHMGGAIAGYFFIRNAHLLRDFFDIFGDSRKTQEPSVRTGTDAEVDRILAKVHRDGLASLSNEERHTLRHASQRRAPS